MTRETFMPLVRICCLPFLVLSLVLSIAAVALRVSAGGLQAAAYFLDDFVDEVTR